MVLLLKSFKWRTPVYLQNQPSNSSLLSLFFYYVFLVIRLFRASHSTFSLFYLRPLLSPLFLSFLLFPHLSSFNLNSSFSFYSCLIYHFSFSSLFYPAFFFPSSQHKSVFLFIFLSSLCQIAAGSGGKVSQRGQSTCQSQRSSSPLLARMSRARQPRSKTPNGHSQV